ncbi:hypothetical protein TGME49_256850 [Toxoplasma gondii ME49]|uniref:Trichohyalin-plectin-homology domain-containing protein n=4 Tax=Toxoplasma gondii TaxID=5811 RepID=A0A125YTJ9_TOXGV|nr:hypothetical protein TGME49_256850 [Toxoplasma gondii ME49]EPT29218.1 hypothetical protein TGME49_256850 [Toxoplasma gondii ME49]ESS28639.1 hypothetical protein TGVEG_256850 [Toxoplasma gondii VEG]KYF45772.1 hypothetical protein TGARI_256850 [Toxoplasma gondii ARI]|eukprot:XP_002364932.2 hypothetical protein TGME49_256850 [Toxoplasma gondii ME49]
MASYGGRVPDLSPTSGTEVPFYGTRCHKYHEAQKQQREVVLTEGDMEKIKELLLGNKTDPARAADAEMRRQDHLQSIKKVEGWTNTLQSNLAKRVEQRAKRLADEEAARVAIDEEEAVLKQKRRMELLKRADDTLAANNEKYRALKTGLMQGDWLRCLEEQKKWKERLANVEAMRAAHYNKVLARTEQEKADREARDRAEKQTKMKELQAGRQLQYEEAQEKRIREKHEREETGKRIRDETRRALEAMEAQEEQKRIRVREEKQAMKRQLDEEVRLNKLRRENERLEEKAALDESTAYEKREAIVKEREAYLRQEDARARERRIQDLAWRLEKLKEEEAQRLARDVERQQEKDAAREGEEKRKREERYILIAQDRANQIRRKREEAETQRREDAELTRNYLEASKLADAEERRAAEERKLAMREVAQIQMQQMRDTRRRRTQEREDEKRAFNDTFKQIVEQEERVDACAARCIGNAIRDGENPKPIAAAMNRYLIASGAKPPRKAAQQKTSNIFNADVDTDSASEEENAEK